MRDIWRDTERGSDPPEETEAQSLGSIWSSESGTASAPHPGLQRDIWEKDPGPDTVPEVVLEPTAAPEEPLHPKAEKARRPKSKKPKGRSRRERPARRRVLSVVVLGILLATGLLVADGVFATLSLRSDMQQAADLLETGRTKVSEGEIEAAHADFTKALDLAGSAADSGDRPAYRVGTALPVIGGDVGVVRALTRATLLTARAATTATEAVLPLNLEQGVAGSLFDSGDLDLDALKSASPALGEADGLLAEAQTELDDAGDASLRPVQDAVGEARDQLRDAKRTTHTAALMFDLLPELLGANGERRYLLAFQALGESRGTGGLVSFVGVLRSKDGSIDLRDIGSYGDLEADPVTGAPDWFAQNYSFQSATQQWQQANVSPNFPVVSEVFLEMYEDAVGKELDGVIAMDPVALETFLGATGPLDASLDGEQLDSSNAARIMMVDSYEKIPDRAAQDAFLIDVVKKFWAKVDEGPLEPTVLAEALGESIRTQHLKVFLNDNEHQTSIQELDADGTYDASGPNVQMVFTNNYSENKVDYFVKRRTDTKLQISTDGALEVRTTVRLKNTVPEGAPDLLRGPQLEDFPPGTLRSLVSVLMPEGAEAGSLSIDGKNTALLTYTDDQNPVVWSFVDIPPGETRSLKLRYSLPAITVAELGRNGLGFTLFPQTSPRPERYSISANAAGLLLDGDTEHLSGTLDVPTTFRLTYAAD